MKLILAMGENSSFIFLSHVKTVSFSNFKIGYVVLHMTAKKLIFSIQFANMYSNEIMNSRVFSLQSCLR